MRKKWTTDEDKKLLSLSSLSSKEMAKHFPHRTEASVKGRVAYLKRLDEAKKLGQCSWSVVYSGIVGDDMTHFRVELEWKPDGNRVEYVSEIPKYAFVCGRLTDCAIYRMANTMFNGKLHKILPLLKALASIEDSRKRMLNVHTYADGLVLDIKKNTAIVQSAMEKKEIRRLFEKYRAIYTAISMYNN